MKNFNRKAKFCKRIWKNEMKYRKYIFSSYKTKFYNIFSIYLKTI